MTASGSENEHQLKQDYFCFLYLNSWPRPLELKVIDGLLVPPGKASTLLTDCLITGVSLPRKRDTSKTIPTYKPYWRSWVVIFEELFGCHDILVLVKVP